MKRMPPVAVEILLHTYYSPQPSSFKGTQVYNDWMRWFMANELIVEVHEGQLEVTARGAALVEMICTTPLPVSKTEWVDPRDKDHV